MSGVLNEALFPKNHQNPNKPEQICTHSATHLVFAKFTRGLEDLLLAPIIKKNQNITAYELS